MSDTLVTKDLIAFTARGVAVTAGSAGEPVIIATSRGPTLALSVPDRITVGILIESLCAHLRQPAPVAPARASVVGGATVTPLRVPCDEIAPAISNDHQPALALRFGDLWMQVPFPVDGLPTLIEGLAKLRAALGSGSTQKQ